MYIETIRLKNFRNYTDQTITLKNGINLFYGKNAQGKTNVIESIFLCSMGKSFRSRKEKELIQFNKEEAKIEIIYHKKDRDGKIKYNIAEKKNIFINDVLIQKMSDILGNINIVLFSPEDINIIKEGPSNRRKFLNMLISQLRPQYVYYYNLYIKTLEQRNSYLKNISFETQNKDLLEIYDEKLAEYGSVLYQYREEYVKKIKEKIEKIHLKVTKEKETIKLKYISDCENKEKYLQNLKNNRKQDIERGHTTLGIHRDDIYFFINGKRVDTYGSQGQQRTSILSLKLAELEIVKEEIGEHPVLLLDDFMSELDSERRSTLLKNIENTQIIITCTEKIEIENLKTNVYEVKEGQVFEKNISE